MEDTLSTLTDQRPAREVCATLTENKSQTRAAVITTDMSQTSTKISDAQAGLHELTSSANDVRTSTKKGISKQVVYRNTVPSLRESFFTRSHESTMKTEFPLSPALVQSSAEAEGTDSDAPTRSAGIHEVIDKVVKKQFEIERLAFTHEKPKTIKEMGLCSFCFLCSGKGHKKHQGVTESNSPEELEYSYRDPPLRNLAIVPFVCSIQIVWDILKHFSGVFNKQEGLVHVPILLLMTLVLNGLMLLFIFAMRRGILISTRFEKVKHRRDIIWWYFFWSAAINEMCDILSGAYGITQPYLLTLIAGSVAFGEQGYLRETRLHVVMVMMNLCVTLVLMFFVWIFALEGQNALLDYHWATMPETWSIRRRWGNLPFVIAFQTISAWCSYVKHKVHREERHLRDKAQNQMHVLKGRLLFTDKMLRMSLPAEIVVRIDAASGGLAHVGIADHFESAAVCFIKFTGFDAAFRLYSTVEAVALLNVLYKTIDRRLDKFRVEKIKTIGDTYMAVCGVPNVDIWYAQNMADFCFQVVAIAKKFNKSLDKGVKVTETDLYRTVKNDSDGMSKELSQSDLENNGAQVSPFHIDTKVGIACGQLVAGVIGRKNFLYDIWGDAVNVASRMYSSGLKGRIQTTSEMAKKLSAEFELESRGVIDVKGKGPMHTYWLVEARSNLQARRESRKVSIAEIKSDNLVIPKVTHTNILRAKSSHNDLELNNDSSDQSFMDSFGIESSLGVSIDYLKPDEEGEPDDVGSGGQKDKSKFVQTRSSNVSDHLVARPKGEGEAKTSAFPNAERDMPAHYGKNRSKMRRNQSLSDGPGSEMDTPWYQILDQNTEDSNKLEVDFLQQYRCCHYKQDQHAVHVYAMEDDFIRNRNTNLRHHLQVTWLVTMLFWMFSSRSLESILALGQALSRNELDFTLDLNLYLIGPSFVLYLLIHVKNAHYDWKVTLHGAQNTFRSVREDPINKDQLSSLHAHRDSDECTWCGGPRGVLCKNINNCAARIIRALCCIKCCFSGLGTFYSDSQRAEVRQSLVRRSVRPSKTSGDENTSSATQGVLEPTAADVDNVLYTPARCCCLGHAAACNRVQVSRFLIWCALIALITGFTLQAAYVNVYYSYCIWIVFILQNQFSSLKHSDELILTFLCTLVYTLVMLPGPFGTCCFDPPPYNNSARCTLYWREWCAQKSVDPVRFLSFTKIQDVTNATGSAVLNRLHFVSEHNILLSAINNTWNQQIFAGSWLVDFNIDRLIPVLLVVIVCGRSTSRRARQIFLHQMHIARQHRVIEKTTSEHENLLTVPKQLWYLGSENIDKVIDGFGSLLFADIVAFTVCSSTLSQTPMELVLVLNEMFQQFDKAAAAHGVKKIKTLGDCYVASAGILEVTSDHASAILSFGLAMHEKIENLQDQEALKPIFAKMGPNYRLQIRVGVHSGSIIGGVVGSKKSQFDIWGETVDVANFMESSGVAQRVHVSHSTWLRSRYKLRESDQKKKFSFESRGLIDLSSCGVDEQMETFLVTLSKD